nr:extracellular solute-binding protein [Myxococcota bacterium]
MIATRSRRAALGAALVALIVLPSAVTLTLVSPAGGQERSRLVLWHSYGEREERGLAAAVAAFEQQHAGIDVQVNAIPFGAYASKLEAAIPVRRGPDLFIDAHDRLPSYLEAGLLQPFGALDPALEDDLERAHLDVLTADGTLYALPLSVKSAVLFVNDALVGEHAIESLEDLEALRSELPEGSFPLAWDADDAYQFAALLHAYDGALLDDEGRYGFASPAAERALEHLLRLMHARVIPEETSYELVRDLFRGGRAAAAISGPWFANDLGAELRWSVHPLPIVRAAGDRAMTPFATVESAMIAEGARDPEGARLLASFLGGREGALLRALEGDHIVASRSAWQEPRR